MAGDTKLQILFLEAICRDTEDGANTIHDILCEIISCNMIPHEMLREIETGKERTNFSVKL